MSTESERGSQRLPVKVRAAIVDAGEQRPGHLSDLSGSGCQLRFEQPGSADSPAIGTVVTLVLPGVGDLPAEVIGLTAVFVRLRFGSLPADVTTRLTTFLGDLKATTFDTYEDWH